MPWPVSRTLSSSIPSRAASATSMLPPAGVKRIAFESRY
jgi:hypothetical protein